MGTRPDFKLLVLRTTGNPGGVLCTCVKHDSFLIVLKLSNCYLSILHMKQVGEPNGISDCYIFLEGREAGWSISCRVL